MPASAGQKMHSYPLRIKGLSATTYNDDKLTARIEADELRVNQRRFFVFNIRPFNEATLTNARLEVHLYKHMPLKANLFSSAKNILGLDKKGKSRMRGLGLITRGVVNGFTLEVYKAGKLSLRVKAEKAYIDFKKKKTELLNAGLEDVQSKKLIKSRSVIWDNEENVFRIPGIYIATTPRGTARGKGIKVDFDFAVSLLRTHASKAPSEKKGR